MIEESIKDYINDANYRIIKMQNMKTNEEDIILLLKDLSGIVETIEKLRDNLAKKLDKYIIKN